MFCHACSVDADIELPPYPCRKCYGDGTPYAAIRATVHGNPVPRSDCPTCDGAGVESCQFLGRFGECMAPAPYIDEDTGEAFCKPCWLRIIGLSDIEGETRWS